MTTWKSSLETLDKAYEYAKEQANIKPEDLVNRFHITKAEAKAIKAQIIQYRKNTRGLI